MKSGEICYYNYITFLYLFQGLDTKKLHFPTLVSTCDVGG